MTADFAADVRVRSVPQAVAEAKHFLAQGIELANTHEFEQAIVHFSQAVRLSLTVLRDFPIPDPIDVAKRALSSEEVTDVEIIATQSFYHRGCALCRIGRYKDAIADFTHLIHQPPTSSAIPADWLITKLTEIYIHRGNAYRRLGLHPQAIADLNQGVSRSGGSAQSYSCRGLIHLGMGNCRQAISDFNQALSLHPTFAQGYLWRGFAQLHNGNTALAIIDLSRAIAAIPTCAEAFNHRGVAYFYQGELHQAQADFSQAIQLDRQFAEAHNNRGNVLQLLGDSAAARVDYDRAIALNANLSELTFNRASNAELPEIAISGYDTGASPNSAAFYRQRARIKAQEGRYEAAIADYTQAIETMPTADAFYKRGKLYLEVGKHEKALADFDRAIERSPDYGKVYCDRAQLRFKLQDVKGALSDTNQAINLLPDSAASMYSTRCLTHVSLGNQKAALADFERLIGHIQSSSQTSKDSTSIGSVGG